MDALEMCARDLCNVLQESQKLQEENERLQNKLDIAVKALKFISSQSYGKDMYDCAKGTLKQLEELEK